MLRHYINSLTPNVQGEILKYLRLKVSNSIIVIIIQLIQESPKTYHFFLVNWHPPCKNKNIKKNQNKPTETKK